MNLSTHPSVEAHLSRFSIECETEDRAKSLVHFLVGHTLAREGCTVRIATHRYHRHTPVSELLRFADHFGGNLVRESTVWS